MTTELLRDAIVDRLKQTNYENKELTIWSVAHKLATHQWFIFEAQDPSVVQDTLGVFGYDDIEKLRLDATALMLELSNELEPADWEECFKSRRNNPPFLDVQNKS